MVVRNAIIGGLLGLVLWLPMFYYTSNKPAATMTVKLRTPTPIVTTGILTVTHADGQEQAIRVEAGDTFVLRSINDYKD